MNIEQMINPEAADYSDNWTVKYPRRVDDSEHSQLVEAVANGSIERLLKENSLNSADFYFKVLIKTLKDDDSYIFSVTAFAFRHTEETKRLLDFNPSDIMPAEEKRLS